MSQTNPHAQFRSSQTSHPRRRPRRQPDINGCQCVAILIGCCLCGPCYCLGRFLKSKSQPLRRDLERRIDEKRQERHRAEEEKNRSPLILLGSRPRPGLPAWPGARARPITPPPSLGDAPSLKTIQQTGAFFTRLPLEVRRLVYDFALGRGELVRLEVEGRRLNAERCNSQTREFWSEDGAWMTLPARGCKHMDFLHEDSERFQRHAANISLLCTCRQVYLEAISSLCTAPTFVLAMDYTLPTLSYLPYFLLSQRLDQVRSLCIQWILRRGFDVQGVRPAWDACWDFLARLPSLQDLYIRFEWDDSFPVRFDCSLFEVQLRDCVTRVNVTNRFIVVLPFLDRGLVMHVGKSAIKYEKMKELGI